MLIIVLFDSNFNIPQIMASNIHLRGLKMSNLYVVNITLKTYPLAGQVIGRRKCFWV